MNAEQITTLTKIGFSEIEAEIYILLLKESNLTGYRLSRLVGKPKSTVYKALDALQKKGAVVADEAAKSKEFSAVPYNEFFDMKEREFSLNRKQAEELLRSIKSGPAKPGLYQMEKIDQVFNKCVEIIKRAKTTILVACCHLEDKKVIEALEQAAANNVKVSVECHLPVPDIKGCDFAFNEGSKYRAAGFPYNWLEIFVDGEEYVISLMNKDSSKLTRAVWCNEPYLSLITFNSNVNSMILTKVKQYLFEDRNKKEILDLISEKSREYYHDLSKYLG